MKTLITLIFLVFSMISCVPTPEVVYTISGYIYTDCNKLPLANEEIELFQEIETNILTGNSTGGILATAQTDENGYFVLTYTPENKSQVLIKTASGNNLIGVPIDTNIYDLIAYTNPICNIQVSLNVINPYAIGDTLVIGNFITLENMKVPCPLSSGVLYTAANFHLLGMNYFGVPEEINWYFTPYNDHSMRKEFVINNYCSDTVFVTVDIY